MNWLKELSRRLKYLWHRGSFDRELDAEVQFHIESRADELEQSGMSRSKALSRARREFGSIALAREDSRAAWQFRWLQDLAVDLRHALRTFRRSLAFTLTAVISLAPAWSCGSAVPLLGYTTSPIPVTLPATRLSE